MKHAQYNITFHVFLSLFRFLEEQTKKAKSLENGKKTQTNDVDVAQGKVNGNDGEVSLNSLLKASPFLSADGEEEEEMTNKSQLKSQEKSWHNEDELAKLKTKATYSARELFEERFGKWQNAAYSQVAKCNLGDMEEDLYGNRKQNYPASIATAVAKRELAEKFEETCPDMGSNARKMEKSSSILSATATRRNSDREMFMLRNEDSPLMSSRKQEAKVNVRMDCLGDSLLG